MFTEADIQELSDNDLIQAGDLISTELDRRNKVKSAASDIDRIIQGYQDALGRADGDEWVQPTSAVDAYPKGATVTHHDTTWTSTTPANVWEPGSAGWVEAPAEDGTPAEYRQPTGSVDAYQAGDRVTYQGQVYESVIDGNVWAPDAYPDGWEKVD
ncbi:carbohydrate-binding protein [Kocuria sp. TGY1127_2]|uniref:carbohydrate-binding protein n=1 Tax=Kocuria sp. TGY1127_2 TaxID=2711328 RepID=UPI0015BA767F|nr:carbohydrate-binding protein [Kocuria sp. TGY1127_2]